MRILLIVNNFPPEIGSAAHMFYDLSKKLAKDGHAVTVVSTFPRTYNLDQYGKKEWILRYRGKKFLRELLSGICLIRVPPLSTKRDNLSLRGLEHFIQPLLLFVGGLFSGRQDVVLVYSPPPQLGLAGYFLSKLKSAKLVVNIQDVYPDTLVDIGVLKKEKISHRILIAALNLIVKILYKVSGYITVHSAGNKEYLVAHGAPCEKIVVVNNWVDVNKIKPMDNFNKYRAKFSLTGKFIVTYAGIMSFSQGLDTLIDAANRLKEFEDILFLLAGDGVQKNALVKKAEQMHLNNVLFLPFQPVNEYPFLLGASNVCLVSLAKTTKTPVVPKKLLDIMSAGRAVLASVPLDGDVPLIIKESNCGLAVEPADSQAMADAIKKLYLNPELTRTFGINGRMYAVKHFSLDACTSKMEELFSSLIAKDAKLNQS
jgi:glycosyltransferase involved in cell wall biosynthesis